MALARGAGTRRRRAREDRRAAERADFLDKFAAERDRRRDASPRRLRLRDIVGGAERQRPQADFGAAARQRRDHDHDEVALLLQQQRQRRNAVELRHVDVEHDDVGVALLDPRHRFAPGAQRCDDSHVGLGIDPARQQAAHDDGVVDDHHADRLVGPAAPDWAAARTVLMQLELSIRGLYSTLAAARTMI